MVEESGSTTSSERATDSEESAPGVDPAGADPQSAKPNGKVTTFPATSSVSPEEAQRRLEAAAKILATGALRAALAAKRRKEPEE